MKLRDPGEKLGEITGKNVEELSKKLPQGREWHSFHVRLITPMFGGGVCKGEPDSDMPVRASAIRGQLRYWWRFLRKNHPEESCRLNGEELFSREGEIWGKMAEGEQDGASKVFLRVRNASQPTITPFSAEDNKKYGYVLFPAREQQNENISAKRLVRPGMTFTLDITCPDELWDTILKTVRWWATFGGLGGRTRRGCGSVWIKEITPVSQQEVNNVGGRLEFYGHYRSDDALEAWEKAGKTLADFRQKPDIGRNPGFGRSRWPEADSIREITNTFSRTKTGSKCKEHRPTHRARIAFPRAAFGLPIIFKFKTTDEVCGDPPQTELLPSGGERLASPLILTPYPVMIGNQLKYRPAALLMPNSHINALQLELKYTGQDTPLPAVPEGKEEQWAESGWKNWQKEWWNQEKKQHVFPMQKAGGNNALEAFMNFFAKGGRL